MNLAAVAAEVKERALEIKSLIFLENKDYEDQKVPEAARPQTGGGGGGNEGESFLFTLA